MDKIIIDQTGIQITKDDIRKTISRELTDVNTAYYKKLKSAFKKSQGDYVRQIQLQVEEEYKMITALAGLYERILEYIQEAARQVESVDQMFAAPKIELEDWNGKIK